MRDDDIIAGRYKKVCRIGKGAFGQIFKGIDLRTNKQVAIKCETVPYYQS